MKKIKGLIHQNRLANFNQTWHKAYLREGIKFIQMKGPVLFLWDNNVMTNSEKSLQIEYVCHKLIKRCFRIVYCMLICRKYVTTSMPEIKIELLSFFPSQDIQFWGIFLFGVLHVRPTGELCIHMETSFTVWNHKFM